MGKTVPRPQSGRLAFDDRPRDNPDAHDTLQSTHGERPFTEIRNHTEMNFILESALAAIGLLAGMLLLFEVGRRIGVARLARDPHGGTIGTGPVEAAVFGLLGLLLAFTFSGAASRFEARRHLITQETNAIGTAYLRIDLLPADAQPEMRKLFRRYLETRIATYQHSEDTAATQATLADAQSLQTQLWAMAVSASSRPDSARHTALLLLPALNDMFDITTTRVAASRNHPPPVVFMLLIAMSLVSALLVGYVMSGSRVRNWFYILIISATMSLTLYVILDLEYPRAGLIRIDAADQALVDLQKSLK